MNAVKNQVLGLSAGGAMTIAVMSNNPGRGDDIDANANVLKHTTSFGQATQVLTITHEGMH
jgi:hypothetical protein